MSGLRILRAYLRFFLWRFRFVNMVLSVAVIGTVAATTVPDLTREALPSLASATNVLGASTNGSPSNTTTGTNAGASLPSQGVSQNATSGYIHTSGTKLMNASNQEVRLTGINWFGLETGSYAPHGLWARNWGEMLDQMVQAGFNTLRLPYSNQLFDPSSKPNGVDYAKNPDLQGLSGLEIMDKIIDGAGQRGMKVILDRHRPTSEAQSELWYTDKVSEERWMSDWVMLAKRYLGKTAVIGADLHNEPKGAATWGDGNIKTDWRLAAERAGNAILEANPDWLIIVEGIEKHESHYYWWGGNLTSAQNAPVRLSRPDKLMYSAHDYGPGVYMQEWFKAPDFPNNLPKLWDERWAFVQKQGMAPLLMGEFGGRSVGQDLEGTWQRTLMQFLKDNSISYTYWSWNPNSGDTGGVLKDDWTTIDQAKLDVLAAYSWPMLDKPKAAP